MENVLTTVPTLQDIEEAHARIKPHVHRTPIITSENINEITGCEIYFKCENFQKVGAFKARGGINTILSIDKSKLANGVATHSSGNHAQGVAFGAKIAGIKAYIVMPNNASVVKKNAVLGYGAEIIECEPTLAARERTLSDIIEKTGAELIHPYNDYRIICGQATAAKELIEDLDVTLDYMLAPVGGGGLISGTALATKYMSPSTKVIGCEPAAADDAYRSLKAGKLCTNDSPPKTMADGLLTNLGEKNFEIIASNVAEIMTVKEADILAAMRLVWERMKMIIEPSGAVPLAAVLQNKAFYKNKKVGIIISGGNVDLDKFFNR